MYTVIVSIAEIYRQKTKEKAKYAERTDLETLSKWGY